MSSVFPLPAFHDARPAPADFRRSVLHGLAGRPKAVPPKFFYDARGSALFDLICDLPEYYVTRTELAILGRRAPEIAVLAGPGTVLLEPGAGSCRKVEILLPQLRPAMYVPVDISGEHIKAAAARVALNNPGIEVRAACADFTQLAALDVILPAEGRRIAFFPGSTIGNFEPRAAEAFLGDIARLVGHGGALIIGVDLKKSPALLHAAYNDLQGVTARFNLNLLQRINRELDGGFRPTTFRHRAFYEPAAGRVEMHLESTIAQSVAVGDALYDFSAGETIHTENSYKYHVNEFQALAGRAGFMPVTCWVDSGRLFSVHFLENVG